MPMLQARTDAASGAGTEAGTCRGLRYQVDFTVRIPLTADGILLGIAFLPRLKDLLG
jgi:hypothetical protein